MTLLHSNLARLGLGAALLAGSVLSGPAGVVQAQAPTRSGVGRNGSTPTGNGSFSSAGASATNATGTPTSSAAVSRTVSGRVVDALHGAPVPRALVRLNARAALTDALGRFSFPEFTDAQGTVSVTKPGFTAAADGSDGLLPQKIANLDASVELQLYPDALITGTVTGRDGLPLHHVLLTLYRAGYTAAGLIPQEAGIAVTDSQGRFRFQQPAGRFRVALRYTPQLPETGQAVLPATFPTEPFNSPSGFLAVASGQERHVDVRADTGSSYPVSIRVDGGGAEGGRGLRVSVQTQAGETFQTQAPGTGIDGEFRLTLPAGTYGLRVESENRDEALEGTGRVTVPVRDGSSLPVHLSPLTDLLVEVALDPSNSVAPATGTGSSTAQVTTPQLPGLPQLNLLLYNLADPLNMTDMRPRASQNQTFSFRVPAGRYRLTAPGNGTWTVRSAYAGSTNLMSDELVVGDAAGSETIRLTVSNVTGRLDGTVQLPAGVVTGWVYLLPTTPSLTGFLMQRINADGTFGRNLPVGTYTAFAVPERLQLDLRDPRVAGPLAAGGSTVEITANGKSAVTLEMKIVPGGAQ